MVDGHQWAIPFTNPEGRVRWQPVTPDGRRLTESTLSPWMKPGDYGYGYHRPALYRSKAWAEHKAQRRWRRIYQEFKPAQ